MSCYEPRAGFYDQVAQSYDELYALPKDYTIQQGLWLSRQLSKGRILDLGCGTGRMLPVLADLDMGHVVGLDCSKAMLALAHNKQKAASSLIQADGALGLPFKDKTFQTVVCLHSTLIHIDKFEAIKKTAREVERVLKPGGIFVIELPHPESFPNTKTWLKAKKGMYYRNLNDGRTEIRLDINKGLKTRVRIIATYELGSVLAPFPIVEVYPGFSGGSFDPSEGDLMVVLARKDRL